MDSVLLTRSPEPPRSRLLIIRFSMLAPPEWRAMRFLQEAVVVAARGRRLRCSSQSAGRFRRVEWLSCLER